MTKPTIALAIPHASFRPERVASMTRLVEALDAGGGYRNITGDEGAHFKVFADREPYVAWATKLWRWLEDSGADWGLQLQDDTKVAPNFWRALRAMLAADVVPERDVLCLESANPTAPMFHQLGDPWFTSADMVIGNGYLARRSVFRDFRDFREFRLKPGAFDGDKPALTEDTLFGIFCMVTGRKVWHPTVTIIDHDLSIPSTCGNEKHPNRRPPLRWDNAELPLERFEDPGFWKPTKRVPHIGRAYGLSHHGAKTWVKDVSAAEFEKMNADDGRQEVIRAKAEMRVILPREIFPTVMIATPSRGLPVPEYMQTVFACQAKAAVEIAQPHETAGWWHWRDDIVRVRSRMLQRFQRSRYSLLWYLDDDVSCDPVVLEGMIATGRDFVVCPYPSKLIDWEAVAKGEIPSAHAAEARALKFDNVMPLASERAIERNCVEIKAAGLGCALITRKGVEKLIKHYEQLENEMPRKLVDQAEAFLLSHLEEHGDSPLERLSGLLLDVRREAIMNPPIMFDDPTTGRTCMPFAMKPCDVTGNDGTTRRSLLSEDLSFCERWRASGQQIWMYVGPGAPASHHGMFTFRGLKESLIPPEVANETAA